VSTKPTYKKWSLLSGAIKRLLDIVFSLAAIIVLSPIMIIVALLVATTGSQILYSQERIGKNFKPFKIYKFRSMIVGAEDNEPQLAYEGDNRITRVGRVIRRRKLDELPQFFNVLAGDMSIVGPRPERNYFIKLITNDFPEYANLLQVKPGITGAGIVSYGYAHNVEEMIERASVDLDYLEQLSLAKDLGILLKTVVVVLGFGKN